jgi:biopolymer transport protein ExbD
MSLPAGIEAPLPPETAQLRAAIKAARSIGLNTADVAISALEHALDQLATLRARLAQLTADNEQLKKDLSNAVGVIAEAGLL